MRFLHMLVCIALIGVLLVGLCGCTETGADSGHTGTSTTTTTIASKPTSVNGKLTFPLTVWVTAGSMHVRSGPGPHYESIGGTRAGDTWTAIAKEGDWFKIEFTNGKEGYVNAQYVLLTDPAKTTTTTTTTTTTIVTTTTTTATPMG